MQNYRPEIDGLRSIAVLCVILYHAKLEVFGRTLFEGGFIGVDIFFVISGYLITRIILSELYTKNSFNFKNFYERRARRILPMLFVVIVFSLLLGWQRLLPSAYIELGQSALAAIFFVSNYFFYSATTAYDADSSLVMPLLHTWSLGIEEQFYILFPIIILLLHKFTKGKIFFPIVVIFAVSLAMGEVFSQNYSELNFFWPVSRFWELLTGSILAYAELKRWTISGRYLPMVLSLAGMSMILGSIVVFGSDTRHPGIITTVPVIGVAL